MNMPINVQQDQNGSINKAFYDFINQSVLSRLSLNQGDFWLNLQNLINDFAPKNRELLETRQQLQAQIDQWHRDTRGQLTNPVAQSKAFLKQINYLVEEVADFKIDTKNVDPEIATIAGPQLVVPVKNARFALNAANARWGSLYDALYASDVIAQTPGLKICNKHNTARGNHVIQKAKDFLDQTFPLDSGSHHDVTSYLVYYQHLLAMFPDGSTQGLKDPCQFVALSGHKSEPTDIVLKNNGLHVVIEIDRSGSNGEHDLAGIQDIQIEAALTTIMDFEDSVAAVDVEDKLAVYQNWLGLVQGNLTEQVTKNGETFTRSLNHDRHYTCKDGENYNLAGTSLMMARNVGLLMTSELMHDRDQNPVPEGIIDTVVTALIGAIDIKLGKNSQTGSVYIVKPKLHGPEEVKFTCDLFAQVEDLVQLPRNTLKIGIMDEERRTSVNLKACIFEAKSRVVFINTGFLDRTGDEIHTNMQAGPFMIKNDIKQQVWIDSYERRNVAIGLECGFSGTAQIGKGMWAMPDEMAKMMEQKIAHPQSGATTAWVPSPSAAVLHALHYHQVDVFGLHQQPNTVDLEQSLDQLLTLPIQQRALNKEQIEQELCNNLQGILGYVVRWVDQGIGCSKVPDINNIGLMEDRATLRISSQHIGNWLTHRICSSTQVEECLIRMAKVVDQQNQSDPNYKPLSQSPETNLAFQAARELIFDASLSPSGYTEPALHKFRQQAKS
jgi:malate synthase